MMDEIITNFIDDKMQLLKMRYVSNHRFAFWHDVGVTGISALATALLAAHDSGLAVFSYAKAITPILTGLVTVFVACDHFFKFKVVAADAYKGLVAMQTLKLELDEHNCPDSDNCLEMRPKEAIYNDAKKLMSELSIVPDLDDSVIPWHGRSLFYGFNKN